MDLREKGQIENKSERDHFWIKTRFLYLDMLLQTANLRFQELSVVEFGCGTGQNVDYIKHGSRYSPYVKSVVGQDPFLEKDSFPLVRSLESLSPPYNVGLCLDVLEHLDDDYGAMKEWASYLQRGAFFLVMVPAFSSLWSGHDEFLGHKRRYTLSSLMERIPSPEFHVVQSFYIFSHLYPLAFLTRKVFRRASAGSDLAMPAPWMNHLLYRLGEWEHGGIKMPFGTTAVLLLEKLTKD